MISLLKEKQMLGEYYYKNWSQALQEKIKIQLPLNITGTKTTANRGSKCHMHRLRMAATAKRRDFQQVNHLAVKKWEDEPPHILEIGNTNTKHVTIKLEPPSKLEIA
jgi:hypothetical protein